MPDTPIGQMVKSPPRNPEEPMRITLQNPNAKDLAALVQRVRAMKGRTFPWIEIPKEAAGPAGEVRVPFGDGRGLMELRLAFDINVIGAWRS